MNDSEDEVMWQGKAKLARVANVPIKAINLSCRRLLGEQIDPRRDTFSQRAGILQDWQGLAEQMGSGCEDIQALADKNEKTLHIIEGWSHTSNATIGQLIHFLENMERFDVLENDRLQRRILDDVELYKKKEEELKKTCGITKPALQVCQVESAGLRTFDPRVTSLTPYQEGDEFAQITIDDVANGQRQYYDAFVCYTHDDSEFVQEMRHRLEDCHGIKLCIPARDLLAGSARETVLAHLIKERCTKMIIILSPSYSKSMECDFMTKFGHSIAPGAMAKKLIPVMVKRPCPVPDILRFIAMVDHTKCDLSEWFWDKLARSMHENDCSSFMSRSATWACPEVVRYPTYMDDDKVSSRTAKQLEHQPNPQRSYQLTNRDCNRGMDQPMYQHPGYAVTSVAGTTPQDSMRMHYRDPSQNCSNSSGNQRQVFGSEQQHQRSLPENQVQQSQGPLIITSTSSDVATSLPGSFSMAASGNHGHTGVFSAHGCVPPKGYTQYSEPGMASLHVGCNQPNTTQQSSGLNLHISSKSNFFGLSPSTTGRSSSASPKPSKKRKKKKHAASSS